MRPFTPLSRHRRSNGLYFRRIQENRLRIFAMEAPKMAKTDINCVLRRRFLMQKMRFVADLLLPQGSTHRKTSGRLDRNLPSMSFLSGQPRRFDVSFRP